MNHRFLLFGIATFIFVFSCQKKDDLETIAPHKLSVSNTSTTATESTNATQNPSFFHRAVGRPIGKDTAKRWMVNYILKSSLPKEYRINAVALQNILSQPGCVGLCLYYATDDAGKLHILPIGINDSQSIIPMNTVPVETGSISWQTATLWRGRYQEAIKAHFFGANTFDRLINKQGSRTIRTTLATNDTDQPQLLLSNADESDPGNYEDESSPCPPICPKG